MVDVDRQPKRELLLLLPSVQLEAHPRLSSLLIHTLAVASQLHPQGRRLARWLAQNRPLVARSCPAEPGPYCSAGRRSTTHQGKTLRPFETDFNVGLLRNTNMSCNLCLLAGAPTERRRVCTTRRKRTTIAYFGLWSRSSMCQASSVVATSKQWLVDTTGLQAASTVSDRLTEVCF